MKAIFLAAGEGTRLRPLTDNLPKCMVPFRGKPLLQYGIEAMKRAGIENLVAVRGYLKEKISYSEFRYYYNQKYFETNMVATFFCASDEFNDDILVSYSDIIYKSDIVKKLIASPADISVVIDEDWYRQWKLRMDEPLSDAETLKIDEQGNIYELGKKPRSYDEIQGQYIGLIKFNKNILPEITSFYQHLDRRIYYDGQPFNNMYMTSFLQLLIDAGFSVKAVPIHGGWLEIDCLNDLKEMEKSNLWET